MGERRAFLCERSGGRVLLDQRDAVAYVQLDRAFKANSYTREMLDHVEAALREAAGDDGVRVVVITGSGERAFCAGADRGELNQRGPLDALDLRSAQVFRFLAALPKVTMAAINGAAVGGGLELALACDLRLAASTASFSMPETSLGIIPAAGGTFRLPAVVGLGAAKELILGGAVWNAARAHAMGLVHAVTDPNTLMDTVHEWALKVAARCPVALRLAKAALDAHTEGQRASLCEALAQALLDYHRHAGPRTMP
ncbi:enoyl-CoA hydratase/isomerase family protein [Desulfosoma sp.]